MLEICMILGFPMVKWSLIVIPVTLVSWFACMWFVRFTLLFLMLIGLLHIGHLMIFGSQSWMTYMEVLPSLSPLRVFSAAWYSCSG